MTDEVIDQAPVQSVEERIAAQFGVTDEPGETEVQASEPDLFDLEWNGEKFQVPAKLKDAFMQHRDYTQKTQSLAEERKSVDLLRAMAQQRQTESAFFDTIRSESKEIDMIDAYLSQATKADWSSMNTEQLFRHKMELDGIKERRQAIQQAIQDKHNKFQFEVSEKVKELRGKSREIASKSITDFSEETEKAVRSFAQSSGLAESEVDNVLLDPRSFKILWKAMQFDKVQAGTASTAQKVDKVLKVGAATERMPPNVVNKLNFGKAIKAAKATGNSSKVANVIEERLTGIFR